MLNYPTINGGSFQHFLLTKVNMEKFNIPTEYFQTEHPMQKIAVALANYMEKNKFKPSRFDDLRRVYTMISDFMEQEKYHEHIEITCNSIERQGNKEQADLYRTIFKIVKSGNATLLEITKTLIKNAQYD